MGAVPNQDDFKKTSNKLFNCIFGCLLIFIVAYLSALYYLCVTSNITFGDRRAAQLKTILYWNSLFTKEDYGFGFGKRAFIDNKCEYKNCYITNNPNFTDLDKFDAVIFHGPTFRSYFSDKKDFPPTRSSHQYYAYYTIEPPELFPIIDYFNEQFNLTINYRMDADITEYYFEITDLSGKTVAPDWHPLWRKPNTDNDSYQLQLGTDFLERLKKKSKPAAWIVSKCETLNQRMGYVKALKMYIDVDIYGGCGTKKCSTDRECFDLLKNEYFFYMAFENSNCIDYVTEKVYNAINNDCVPIVLNGADMKKFLPPNSYIDALKKTPQQLAELMDYLMKNPAEYAKYFWWRQYYKPAYSVAVHPFCKLCELLHDKTRAPKTYHKLTRWAHGGPGNPTCFH